MLLKVQSNLESAQQAFMIAALVSRQHMHLLIALGNQIHHLCWRLSSGGSDVAGSVCWVSRLYLASQ